MTNAPIVRILDSTNVYKRVLISHETLKACVRNGWDDREIKDMIYDTIALFFNHPRTEIYIRKFTIER